jgi:L-asparaginase
MIAAQTLPAGIYGVMNGKVFAAKDLHKDTKRGRFD